MTAAADAAASSAQATLSERDQALSAAEQSTVAELRAQAERDQAARDELDGAAPLNCVSASPSTSTAWPICNAST